MIRQVSGAGSGAAPVAPTGSPSIEKQVDDLVAFAESNPSSSAVSEKVMSLAQTELSKPIIEIMQSLQILMAGATTPQQQLAIFDAATKCLGDMRKEIAAGRDFELARSMMGTKNDRTGALLASAIDNPTKLKLSWALFTLSAIAARAAVANRGS